MKIFKYLIFLSIFSGIFFIVYHQCDKTGFRRLWTALKIATIIAAILAGLITSPVEKPEFPVPNLNPSIERRLSHQELNSLDDSNSQAILVKTDGSTPSVSTSTSPGRAQPSNFPSGSTGGRRIPHVNPYRTAPRVVDQGLGAAANPAGAGNGGDDSNSNNPRFKDSDQCQNPNYVSQPQKNKKKKKKNSRQVSKKRVIEAYQDFMSKMKKKGYEVIFPEARFLELSTNPQTGEYDEKSIFETEGGLELEAKGIVKNLRRPDNPKVDLDFVAERVGSGETIFIDQKGMIDFGSLSDKGIDISGFPSHESVAFNMGKDSVQQKGKFIGMDQGPASIGEVVHLYNFEKIRNRDETPLLMQAVLNGAEKAGYMDGIIFLNYE